MGATSFSSSSSFHSLQSVPAVFQFSIEPSPGHPSKFVPLPHLQFLQFPRASSIPRLCSFFPSQFPPFSFPSSSSSSMSQQSHLLVAHLSFQPYPNFHITLMLAFSITPSFITTSYKGPSVGLLWAAFPGSPPSRWIQVILIKMVRLQVCMKTSKCVCKCEEECSTDLSVYQLKYRHLKLLCCIPCHIAHSSHLYMAESSFLDYRQKLNFRFMY